MFEARFAHGHVLKKIFESVKDMVPDVNLDCNESGIHLQAMDSSHVSLVSLHLKDTSFESYRCDQNRLLGLNMTSVSKVFKLCGNSDTVTIRHQDNGDTVSFLFENADADRVTEFDLKLMRLDLDSLSLAESEFHVKILMSSNEFKRICGDMVVFADTLRINVTKESVKFSTKGEIGGGTIVMRPRQSDDKNDALEIQCSESVDLQFSLRFLNVFCKAAVLSSTVCIEMRADNPVAVTFALIDGDTSMGCLRYYLAPKNEDNTGGTGEMDE
eukprot:Selendium_serpulae@DN6231_c3_g1_i4.p1